MVQLMNSGNFRSKSDTQCPKKLLVKVEIEDSLDEEHGPINKRSKLSSPFEQQWINGGSTFSIPLPQYNPLDEPSPLGLRLKKSPSLLDLIQMRLSQGNTFTLGATHCENHDLGKKTTDLKGSIGTSVADKLKASNFPASLLRIGSWEYVSRYEGDLVAKCYFAKHKLVWEVLDGGLKSKMEIQWSDITALKANCPDNGLGTLDIVLARQPLFFRETNPQPRKHTLWQATSDFTGGQASIHRQHFLQCPQGLLSKHFEKLFQCDPRLNWLSQQPEIVLESPYFEPSGSVLKGPDETKCHGFDHVKNEDVPTFPCFRDARSPSAAQSSSPKSELRDLVGRTPDLSSRETPSPSSAMDSHAIEEYGSVKAEEPKGPSNWDQFKVPGIHTSMSMSDLVSRIGHCISEQMTSSNLRFSEGLQNHEMLDDLAQYLFSDSNHTYTSDDPSLMSRVNSLCCLLQKDATTVQNLQVNSEGGNPDRPVDGKHIPPKSTLDSTGVNRISADVPPPECEFNNDVPECKKPPAMPRIDSLGDLLLHFPRIASLPQFLFNFPEDGENQAR